MAAVAADSEPAVAAAAAAASLAAIDPADAATGTVASVVARGDRDAGGSGAVGVAGAGEAEAAAAAAAAASESQTGDDGSADAATSAARHKLGRLGAIMKGRRTRRAERERRAAAEAQRSPDYLAPYNPSVADVVDNALQMLRLAPEHRLWDLGCGDGRLLVAACQRHGCCATGVEYDAKLADASRRRAADAGLADAVTVLHANVMDVDFSTARRMYLFLLPEGLRKLQPKLHALLRANHKIDDVGDGGVGGDGAGVSSVCGGDSGGDGTPPSDTRIVTYAFSLPGATPVEVRDHKGTKLRLYTRESLTEEEELGASARHTRATGRARLPGTS